MTFLINCGEVETEDNGISISMSAILTAKNTSSDSLFINFVDNLLGISEFIAENKYAYAEVGIDFDLEGEPIGEYLSFERFLNNPENSEVKRLFTKYCNYVYEEPEVVEGTIWYYFSLRNVNAEMTDEDHAEFCSIFRERLKETDE